MDTIFLVLIASASAAILFYAGNHYGNSVRNQMDMLFTEFYARQVLRVITSVTIERPGGIPDYLLAYLKDQIGRGGGLDAHATKTLQETIKEAMQPLSSAYDYVAILSIQTRPPTTVVVGNYHAPPSYNEKSVSCNTNKGMNEIVQELSVLQKVYSSKTTFFFRVQQTFYPADMILVLWPSGDPNGATFAQRVCS